VRASWLAAVHESMRVGGGAVVARAEAPAVGRNFYRVGVRLRDGTPVALLLNAAVKLVGARRSLDESFVDVPGGDVFARAGFHVAGPADLDEPLRETRLRLLAADERRDAAYHRPDRLGDLLFNRFD
jgi:hypothetical protein